MLILLPCCQDLRELGVGALGPRRWLMAAAAAHAAAASAAAQCDELCHRLPRGSSAQGRDEASGVNAGKLHPVMAAARRGAGAASSPARRADCCICRLFHAVSE